MYGFLQNSSYIVFSPTSGKRFLDECWLIWKDEFDLSVFLNVINDLHQAIQFIHEKDKRALVILDMTVIKHNDNSIHTDVFYKTTNAH